LTAFRRVLCTHPTFCRVGSEAVVRLRRQYPLLLGQSPAYIMLSMVKLDGMYSQLMQREKYVFLL
jgi:hypothetical protein